MGDHLATLGFSPYIPHLSHFWHMIRPRPYEFWVAHDMTFLECCNALLRLPGDSPGGDREVARANELNIPVFYDVFDLERYFELRKRLDPVSVTCSGGTVSAHEPDVV